MAMASDPANLAQAARALVAANSQGALATLRSEDGYPYVSVVDYLPLDNGDIVMLLSRLAEHQKYLSADPRVSLLVAPGLGKADMLAEARVTLLGDVAVIETNDQLRQAYLSRHPQAEQYIDFADFLFYRLHVRQVRYIAGFGRMGWLPDKTYAGR
jgi:putative heme iron utilization protein